MLSRETLMKQLRYEDILKSAKNQKELDEIVRELKKDPDAEIVLEFFFEEFNGSFKELP